jgi:hypothetical protein
MFWTKKNKPYEDPRDVWAARLKRERSELTPAQHAAGEGMAMMWLVAIVAIPCFIYLFITSIF